MRSNKGEPRVRVVKSAAPAHVVHLMALAAIRTESRRPVVGRPAPLVFGRMATVTIRPHADVLMLLAVRMAGLAVSSQVGTDQRKRRPRMALSHVRYQPCLRTVAPNTTRPQLAAMYVVVASGALIFGPFEPESRMARATFHERVLSDQFEPGRGMIELHGPGQLIPRAGSVAVFAGDRKRTMRRRLGSTGATQRQCQKSNGKDPGSH